MRNINMGLSARDEALDGFHGSLSAVGLWRGKQASKVSVILLFNLLLLNSTYRPTY